MVKALKRCADCRKPIEGWFTTRCPACNEKYKAMMRQQNDRMNYEIREQQIKQMAFNREYPFYCKWCGDRFKDYETCDRHEKYQCPKRR